MVCYMYTHSYVPLHETYCYDNIISGSYCAAPTLLLCSYTQAIISITNALPALLSITPATTSPMQVPLRITNHYML